MGESFSQDFKSSGLFFLKAVAMVAVLYLISKIAPVLPSFLFIFIFPLIAVPSTVGALYAVVVNRIYRQEKLTPEGKLAYFNRRWAGWLLGFFLLSLLSSVMFVVQSPKWDTLEWILVFAAIPMYFAIYCVALKRLRKELAVPYRKSAAMKASFYITGVVLCLIYAGVTTFTSAEMPTTMVEALGSQVRPFQDSSAFLLSQMDFFASFLDGVSYYVQSKFASFFLVSFAFRFVLYAGVFFGLVNLFGFSLLERGEMESEFRLLPVEGESIKSMPFIRKYIFVLLGVWFVFSAGYLGLEFEAAKQSISDDAGTVEKTMTDLSLKLAMVFDDTVDKGEAVVEDPASLKEAIEREAIEAIDIYYDECAQNIDSYVEWTQTVFGGVASLTQSWGGFGENMAKDAFMNKVAEPVDLGMVERAYAKFLGVDDVVLNLWKPLKDSDNISWYLLGKDTDGTKEAFKERLQELIDLSRAEALADIGIQQ